MGLCSQPDIDRDAHPLCSSAKPVGVGPALSGLSNAAHQYRVYVFLHRTDAPQNIDSRYRVGFATGKGNFQLENIKRGASVIGSAGSGKTESVVYGFLWHHSRL